MRAMPHHSADWMGPKAVLNRLHIVTSREKSDAFKTDRDAATSTRSESLHVCHVQGTVSGRGKTRGGTKNLSGPSCSSW
jgi:hypothetical protein